MPDARVGGGLQTIFGIFLGLMVTSFIGVGVYTFYPSPARQFRDDIVRIDRAEQAIRNSKAPDDLTTEDRARLQQFADERARAEDRNRTSQEGWGRTTSIVLIAFATLAMSISLLRAVQLPVISNGLLLGGLFTMIYGVGWIIATDTSTSRFVVMTMALAITLALGYVRFVRQRGVPDGRGSGAATGPATSGLEERVRRLEERLDEAANALSRRSS
jgi:hypothetical protein